MRYRKINYLVTYLLLIVFFIPTNTNAFFAQYNSVLDIIKYIGLCWSVIIFVYHKIYLRKKYWPIWFFMACAVISTLLNGNSLKLVFEYVYPIFSSCVLTIYSYYTNTKKGVRNIVVLFSSVLILQAITAIFGGIGTQVDGNNITYICYFMGERVTVSRILIYAVALSTVLIIRERGLLRWVGILAIVSAIYFAIYESVSTAMVSILTFFFVLTLSKILSNEHVWRDLSIFIFAIAAGFVVVGSVSDFFEWFLVDFLGEDMTLNGRIVLWAQALDKIEGWHWIVGNGHGHKYIFSLENWHVGTAHSQYMNILFCFGIIGLLCYFFIVLFPIFASKVENDIMIKRIVFASTIAVIITGIPTSTYLSIYMYVFYVVLVLLIGGGYPRKSNAAYRKLRLKWK